MYPVALSTLRNLETEYESVLKTHTPARSFFFLFIFFFFLRQTPRQNEYHLEERRRGGKHRHPGLWPPIGHQPARGQRQRLLRVRGFAPQQQRPLGDRRGLPARSR